MLKTPYIITILLCVCFFAHAQKNEWIKKPITEWPAISMINEVWYVNGERYVHPSFEYAATGFLIDTGEDTLAATVKHALWVAKMKSMENVDTRGLRRWIMHPKNNIGDSVVIDRLLNLDTTEALSGPKSTITQRDWLVFTTKFRSLSIQPLKPRYSKVQAGELIYFTGCPYAEKECLIKETRVVSTEGNRIILSSPEDLNIGGYSGSPLIDESGFLVGILGGTSFDRKTGKGALYGISTSYLHDILSNKQPLNVALIPITDVIKPLIREKGIKAGLKMLKETINDDSKYLKYEFSVEDINAMADDFAKEGKNDWALEIYKLASREYLTPKTYNNLAKAYVGNGQLALARETYKALLEKWPDDEEGLKEFKSLSQQK